MDAPVLQALEAQLSDADGASIIQMSADSLTAMLLELSKQREAVSELAAKVAKHEEAQVAGIAEAQAGRYNAITEAAVKRWCKKLVTGVVKGETADSDIVNEGLSHGTRIAHRLALACFNICVFSTVTATAESKAGLGVMFRLVEESLPVSGNKLLEEGATLDYVKRMMRKGWAKRAQSRRKHTRFKATASVEKLVRILQLRARSQLASHP